jgi:hypothetical protein
VRLRHDGGPGGTDDDDGLVEHVRAGRTLVVPGGDDLAGLQLHGAAGGADPSDGSGDLEEVAGVDRGQELDPVVADEQPSSPSVMMAISVTMSPNSFSTRAPSTRLPP